MTYFASFFLGEYSNGDLLALMSHYWPYPINVALDEPRRLSLNQFQFVYVPLLVRIPPTPPPPHLSFTAVGQALRFLFKFRMVVALTLLSTCLFQDRSELMVTPRYLASLIVCSWRPWMWYLYLCVGILITLHLSGLNCMSQSLSHFCSLSREAWSSFERMIL